ncbi:MAG: hypothetical protein KKE05_03785 [Nanoarchaeota archaeon]|nr:hypothetical protein [Nanoarchaeota archaeon]
MFLIEMHEEATGQRVIDCKGRVIGGNNGCARCTYDPPNNRRCLHYSQITITYFDIVDETSKRPTSDREQGLCLQEVL